MWDECCEIKQLRKALVLECCIGLDVFAIDRFLVYCGFLLIYDLGKSS